MIFYCILLMIDDVSYWPMISIGPFLRLQVQPCGIECPVLNAQVVRIVFFLLKPLRLKNIIRISVFGQIICPDYYLG